MASMMVIMDRRQAGDPALNRMATGKIAQAEIRKGMTMKIQGAVAFVTGANRGLGLAFARILLELGASKVYAAARNPATVTQTGVVPVKLDVRSQEDVDAAVIAAGDVTLVINNAGIAKLGGVLTASAIEDARDHFETNVIGSLRVAKGFAPVLAANGGGAIINVLSVASWISGPLLGNYAASKSAAWSVTNGLRIELAGQRTQVLGLHAGFIDTDLTDGLDVPKSTPEAIVAETLAALERGDEQVLADEISRQVHTGLSAGHPVYIGEIAARPTPTQVVTAN